MEKIIETIQDISIIAWNAIKNEVDEGLVDSRGFLSECRRWAEEFERNWPKMEEKDLDYMLEVEAFAEKKAREYAKALHSRMGEEHYQVAVTLPLTLWVEVWAHSAEDAIEKAKQIAEDEPYQNWGDDLSTMQAEIVKEG